MGEGIGPPISGPVRFGSHPVHVGEQGAEIAMIRDGQVNEAYTASRPTTSATAS